MSDAAIVILGAGGHGRVSADALRTRGAHILGFIDANQALWGKRVEGFPVLGGDAALDEIKGPVQLVNGIGTIGVQPLRRPTLRRILFEKFHERGYRFAAVAHASAIVAHSVLLGEGAQVMAGAVVQPGAVLGDNCIVNTAAAVDHDCVIGAHSHIASGAVLCGGVTVGAQCHIGSGAIIVQGVTLGDNCMVAAGAVVTEDHGSGVTLMGIPAKVRE